MDKINILFIIDRFRLMGGTEKHILQLASNLNKNKFSCTICALTTNSEMIQRCKDSGIEIVDISLDRIYGINALRQAFKLIKFIKEKRINIVQTFHFGSDTFGALVSKIAGVPNIISSRRDMGDLKKKSHIFVSSRVNKLIDHFIMVSNAVCGSFAEKENIPIEKMITIYNGVELEKWRPTNPAEKAKAKSEFNINSNYFVLGYVAHFRPGKGHNVLFEAIKKIKPEVKDFRVLAVGGRQGNFSDSYLKAYYKQYCKDNELSDNVIFTGYISEVNKIYAAMDVYCLASDNEGCSNSVLEAMASGKPLIATNVGGNPELVVDGGTGFLIPPNDPNALVQAVLKFYMNPELQKKMGDKSRQRVENHFSLEKMIKNLEEFYLGLVENEKY